MARKRAKADTLAELGIEVSLDSVDAALNKLQKSVGSVGKNIDGTFARAFGIGAKHGERTVGHLSRSFVALSNNLGRSLVAAFNAGGKAAQAMGKTAQQAIKSSEGVTKQLLKRRGGGGLLGGDGGFLGAVKSGIGIGTGLFAFEKVKDGFSGLASAFWQTVADANESQRVERKFRSVFAELTPDARKFAESFATEMGRGKSEVKEVMARFQDVFVPVGFDRKKAAGMSETLTRLTMDLSANEGISEQETTDRLMSGLVGNHEALRIFGTLITETTLNAKLLEMGIKGGSHAATEQEKVLARLNLILQSTRDAQGAAGRAGGSFAQESRALYGVWTDLSATIGKLFLPSLAKLTAFFREFVAEISASIGDTEAMGNTWGEAFGKVLEMLEPLKNNAIEFIKDLQSRFDTFTQWLSGRVKEWKDGGMSVSEGIWETLKKGIGQIGKTLYDYIYEPIYNAIYNSLKDAYADFKTGFKDDAVKASVGTADSVMDSMVPGFGFIRKSAEGLAAGMLTSSSESSMLAKLPNAPVTSIDSPTRTLAVPNHGVDMPPAPPSRKADPDAPSIEKWLSGFGIGVKKGDKDKKPEELKLDRSGGGILGMLASGVRGVLSGSVSYANPFENPTSPVNTSSTYDPFDPNARTEPPATAGTDQSTGPTFATIFEKMLENMGQQKELAKPAFIGLQDLQKDLQSQIGEDEARKDRLKLELMEKQRKEAEKQVVALGKVGAEVGKTITSFLGLQP